MDIQCVFAVACVSDMDRSIDWYSKLMGRRPDDQPMRGLVQWHNVDGIGLQLVLDKDMSGFSLITIVTPTMAKTRETLSTTGLQLEPDFQGDFGIIAQINDPDGNRLTIAEPPKMSED